ncbi:hypothetical protein BsWGS_07923 [Bradybaena similaris]
MTHSLCRTVFLQILCGKQCTFQRHVAGVFTNNRKPLIVKEHVHLPSGYEGKLAFLLHGVLTLEECENLIAESERRGYRDEVIRVKTANDEKVIGRQSKRCIIDCEEHTHEIWTRIQEFVPLVYRNRQILGLNERLRFLRYDPGDFFVPHHDGIFLRKTGERSVMSLQLYLNEGFQGGATTFIGSSGNTVSVTPRTGTALIFDHAILHEGSLLVQGCKYTIRTDVMCAPA